MFHLLLRKAQLQLPLSMPAHAELHATLALLAIVSCCQTGWTGKQMQLDSQGALHLFSIPSQVIAGLEAADGDVK